MKKYYVKEKNSKIKKLFKKKIISLKKIFGFFSILSGAAVLGYLLFPVLSWQVYFSHFFVSDSLEVPIPKYLVASSNNIKSMLLERISFISSDYSDARNWYPNISSDIDKGKEIESYTFSIPKLNVKNAIVSTVDYDLAKHLVQYLGTSLPGQNGTAVIFGHSTLPQLFNPKDYKAIFATLHTLKIGDEIIINVNDIVYKYKVYSISITDSSDTNIFAQSYDDSYLTVVTCTPPGTVWKRLVVRARIEKV